MSWTHPDDVPTHLTKRAYALPDAQVSQNEYAAVVADAYDAIRDEILRDIVTRAQEIIPADYYAKPRETPASTAAAVLLGLPQNVVSDIVDVYAREAGRISRERRTARQERVLTRENAAELAAWIGGRVAGGANELVAWGSRDQAVYAHPGDTIVKHPEGPQLIKQGGRA